MPEPLRVLDALGEEFERVASRPPARARVPRALLVAVAVLLGAAGVAGATAYVLTGSPIPGANKQDLPLDQRLEAGTARLAGAEADDPDGGPKWDLRVSRSETGELCTAVGQVHDGVFGLVGLDGRFRALPLQGVDACGSDPEGRPAFIGAREFSAERPEGVRTVVNGVGGERLDEVRVQSGGRDVEVARGGGGTFVAVLRGAVAQVRPTVRLRFEDGTRREYRFGQTRFAEASDPEGEGTWTVRAAPRPDGRRCAQAHPGRRLGPMALTPPVCGHLDRDHVFFDVRAFAANRSRYGWMLGPRTLVYGAADETVERVEVAHAGKRVTAARTGADPGFVAVLPGGTRPADVEVTVVFDGGRRVSARGAFNLRDSEGNPLERPLLEPPDPAPRPPERMDRHMRPVPGSGRIAQRVPLAGLELALRTYETAGGARCAELGWLAPDGSFGARRRDGGVRSRALGGAGGMCAAHGPQHTWGQLLDDGSAYDPKVIGAFVTGHAGRGAREVEVRRLGEPLTARPDENGFFLVATAHTDRPEAGIDLLIDGESTRNRGFTPDPVVPGSLRVIARAPDPEGLQPYGMLQWEQRPGTTCVYEGQLVGDMAGSVRPDPGVFHPYPMHEGGACGAGPEGLPPGEAVTFSISSHAGDADQRLPTAARIARRTLPGMTILSGRARRDVRRVVLQTPRDVRAFRPGAGGAFLVVYDGTFDTGTITVTATLADGSTVRRRHDVER